MGGVWRACWFYGRLLLLFVFVCFSCGDGNTTKESCPLPSGIEAPEELIIGGMAIVESGAFTAVFTTALKLSIDLINQDKCLLPETQLKLEVGFDGESPVQGLSEFLRIQNAYQPVGWTGFAISAVARPVALASPLTETPLVGAFTTLADLSDAEVYPFYSRVYASAAFQVLFWSHLSWIEKCPNTPQDSSGMAAIGTANESGFFFEVDAIFSDGSTNIPDAAERVFVDWGDAEAIVMMGLFGFGLIVTLVCLVVMMLHRSSPIMNYLSPRFVCGMAVGVVVGFTNVLVWTGEPSSARCEARPWLLVLNFVLFFGHLYAKAFRFLWVMRQRKQLLFRPIPDIQLFLCVFFYLLLFAIPCIVWTVGFPLDVTRSDENPDNDKVNIICDGENSDVFLWVLVGLGGLSLVVGVVVAFLNRNYHDFFSEATYIGYTMFTVCVTCCVVLPMLFILSDTPHAFYVVLMLGVFLGNGAVLVFMFFPKVFVILSPGKNVVPIDESGALKTKKSLGASVGAHSSHSNPSNPSQNSSHPSHHNNFRS